MNADEERRTFQERARWDGWSCEELRNASPPRLVREVPAMDKGGMVFLTIVMVLLGIVAVIVGLGAAP